MTVPLNGPPAARAAPIDVLCVTPAGPEGRGGIDRLYAYLRREGAAPALPGITLSFVASRGEEEGARWLLGWPRRLVALARRIRAQRPDIVHINFANRGSAVRKYAVLLLARGAGARTILHLHDRVPEAEVMRGTPGGRLFRAICRRADRVVVLGATAGAEIARLGLAPGRVRMLLNGTPDFAPGLPLPKPRRAQVAILLAGRVGTRKGAGVLIEALALLAERGVSGWHCTIAGDGEVEAYAALAAERGLADRIRFTGWLDQGGVHALMREADVVVLPSLVEALPLSLIEGACAGAALLATPIDNIPEIVHDGENGRLVPRDPAAIAAALADLIADRDLLARMQVASRARFEAAFTLEAFSAGLSRIYAELAAEPGTRSAADAAPAQPDAARLRAVS